MRRQDRLDSHQEQKEKEEKLNMTTNTLRAATEAAQADLAARLMDRYKSSFDDVMGAARLGLSQLRFWTGYNSDRCAVARRVAGDVDMLLTKHTKLVYTDNATPTSPECTKCWLTHHW